MNESFGQSGRIANARWMMPEEVQGRFTFQAGDFWLGRNPFEDERPIGFSDDRHIMLVAGSRGGKGATIIVPNLALWPGSIVAIDPKGENATLLAARRGKGSEHCDGLGQRVFVLDPMQTAEVDPSYRAAFNPLDAIDPSSPDALDDAGRIADALVEIGEGESRFWDESARSLIKTLILHVLTAPDPRFEGKRNLLTVRRLLLSGDKEMVEAMRRRGNENVPSAHVMLWEVISRNEAMGGAIAAAADSILEIAKHSPKQYNSMRGVADRNTEFLDSPGMAECLSRSDFQLSELKTERKGVSLFLSLPDHAMNTHYRWLRMMSALTITAMQKTRGQPASGHRVLMCLDEFAGLRRMDVIERAVAQISGFGMKLFFVLQSLEQLKATYPERWETFLANCGVRIFFASTDNFTNKYVSEALGETEVIRETENYSTQTTETENTSTSRGGSTAQQRSSTEQQSTSQTRTRGGGTSETRGGGTNRSTGGGINASRGGGTNRSHGESSSQSSGGSTGTSHSQSFGPNFFFFGRRDAGNQDGWNQSQSWQTGHSTNSSHGSQSNWSRGSQRNWSQGSQRNWSRGSQENWSTGEQRGRSTSYTTGTTDTESWNETEGRSRAIGETRGLGQQVFKKALLTQDEMTALFRRIDDVDHSAYPGLALVSIAGEPPILLRKSNYYEDECFVHRFDPHPNHPYRALKDIPHIKRRMEAPYMLDLFIPHGDGGHMTRWLKLATPGGEEAFPILINWQISVGSRIEKGDVIAEFSGHDVPGFKLCRLFSPISGTVVGIGETLDRLENSKNGDQPNILSFQYDQPFIRIRCDDDATRYSDKSHYNDLVNTMISDLIHGGIMALNTPKKEKVLKGLLRRIVE